MKARITFAAIIACLAAPALAQEGGTFTGPRIEGRAGWDGNNISIRDTRDFGGRGNFSSGSTASDLSIGAEVGFDFDLGGFVAGAYAGYDSGEVDEPDPQRLITFRTGRNITAGGRLGYAVTPNVLLYAKGGYSNTRITREFETGATAANQALFANFRRNRDGFHYGAGVEVQVGTSGLYGRVDYAHHDYDEFQIDANNRQTFSKNTLLGAIGFRF